MMAKMTMANKTSKPICKSGAIAFNIENKTTCKPIANKMQTKTVNHFVLESIMLYYVTYLERPKQA